MKFTRSTWFSLFVTVLLVAGVVLGVMYNSANKSHKLAQNNLNAERLSLTVLNKQKTDIAAQLAQAVADIAAWNNKIALLQTTLGQASLSLKQTQSKFPASAQTIEYNETIMGLAKSSNLTLRLLVAAEPVLGQLSSAGFNFYTNVFTIDVSGKVSDILDFIDKISTNGIFKTGALTPVNFDIPQPLSQTVKDQMRADIKSQMVSDKDASIKGADRVALIEQALLVLLEESSTGPTIEQMTQAIKDIITRQFNAGVANFLANEIAQAIENNLADTLIDTISTIYSEAIWELFTSEDNAGLLPVFNGPLGDEITEAIQGIPAAVVPGTIKRVITDKLTSIVSDKIIAMVSDASVDVTLAAQITAAEMPTAQLTVTVYSYKGD